MARHRIADNSSSLNGEITSIIAKNTRKNIYVAKPIQNNTPSVP